MASWALGEFGKQAESAISALSKLVEDEDKGVRDCASYALERIRPKPCGEWKRSEQSLLKIQANKSALAIRREASLSRR